MLLNLNAEQARRRHSDEYVAQLLKITRQNYLQKKQTGKFKMEEIRVLLKLYNCKFEYLFATDDHKHAS